MLNRRTRGDSEYSNVKQIFIGDEEVWLVAAEAKNIPARTVIGSFGGGQYVTPKPGDAGVRYEFPGGDKSLVHFEGYDNSQSGVMTFYQMLRTVEDKGIVSYKVANLDVSRATSEGTSAAVDAITIKTTSPKMFKFAAEGENAAEQKKMFWRALKKEALAASTTMTACFRFRFEKVGKNFKPQKIYAVTKTPISLKANIPRRVV
jgi:hypothetical protein